MCLLDIHGHIVRRKNWSIEKCIKANWLVLFIDKNGYGNLTEELYTYIEVDKYGARDICRTNFPEQVDQTDLLS